MHNSRQVLYFVALVPPEPVYSRAQALKEDFASRFHSRAALRSPPHITLHKPFRWLPEKEALLTGPLDTLAAHRQPFPLRLAGFGAFAPRVIYIRAEDSPALQQLQRTVQELAAGRWQQEPASGPFVPHLTLAFRDLKPVVFEVAWTEYRDRDFSASCQIADICLLRHNGRHWQVVHRSRLG